MRRSLAALLTVAAALAMTACGEDSEVTPPASPGTPELAGGAPPEGLEEFEDCLSEQGISPPGPQTVEPGEGVPEPDAPDEQERRAFEECSDELPEGGFQAPPGGGFEGPPPSG